MSSRRSRRRVKTLRTKKAKAAPKPRAKAALKSRQSSKRVPFFPPSIQAVSAHYYAEYERKSARVLANIELRDRVEELRRYVKGFEGSRWDFRRIDRWTPSQRSDATEASKRLRNLIASPHMTVAVPRSKQKRKALKRFTRQDPREMKRFIIFTEAPEKTKLDFSKKGRVRIRYQSGPKNFYFREFFLWRDYNNGKHPVTLSQQRRVLKRMWKDLPEGRYAFWTDTHGMTGKPQEKRFLPEVLTQWYHAYEAGPYAYRHEGLGKVLAGLVYLGSWRNMRQMELKREKARRAYREDIGIRIKKRRRTRSDVQREVFTGILKRVTTRKPKRKHIKKARKHK